MRSLKTMGESRALVFVAEILPSPLVEFMQSIFSTPATVVGSDGGGVERSSRRPLTFGPEEKHPGVSG